MAKFGLHIFAATRRWNKLDFEALLPKLTAHRVKVFEDALLEPAETNGAAQPDDAVDQGLTYLHKMGVKCGATLV
jgi:hypothetical protein